MNVLPSEKEIKELLKNLEIPEKLKDKSVVTSIRINLELWRKFKSRNALLGLDNARVLNDLIGKYVES